jgi:hypothetical protein
MTLRQCIHVVLLLLLGVVVVVSTYIKLSYTADEPFHVFCGMEWWQKGQYTIEALHPPLTRLMVAAPEYWLYPSIKHYFPVIASYWELKIVLSRLGNLPFFIIGGWLVFSWSRKLSGYNQALCSLALYVSCPILLGHAGLATTDMGYTVMFVWAMMACINWIEKPTVRASLVAGVSVALMAGAKFSAFIHWPIGMLVVLAAQFFVQWRSGKNRILIGKTHIIHGIIYVAPIFAFILGALYFFNYGSLLDGINEAYIKNQKGHAIWLFEPLHNQGVWYFFPVVFFYKTPLPFLIAAFYGIFLIFRRLKHDNNAISQLLPFMIAMAVLMVSMTGNINLGVRHVMPLYPLLAVPAGYGLYCIWQSKQVGRYVALFLVFWQLFGAVKSYPEFIAYYNELAGSRPEYISLDSDFDWGQNIILGDKAVREMGIGRYRLCARNLNITKTSIAYFLAKKPDDCAGRPTIGWTLISRTLLPAQVPAYAWLNDYKPVAAVGQTMYLYYVAPWHVMEYWRYVSPRDESGNFMRYRDMVAQTSACKTGVYTSGILSWRARVYVSVKAALPAHMSGCIIKQSVK